MVEADSVVKRGRHNQLPDVERKALKRSLPGAPGRQLGDRANNFQGEQGPAFLLQMAHCRVEGPTSGGLWKWLSWGGRNKHNNEHPFRYQLGQLSLKKKHPNYCHLTAGCCLSNCSAGLIQAPPLM